MPLLDFRMRLSAPHEISAIRALRRAVWEGLAVDEHRLSTLVTDGHDDHALHSVIDDAAGAICAAARTCVHQSVAELPMWPAFRVPNLNVLAPIACCARLVVAADSRGRGFGEALERRILEVADAMGAATALAVAAPDAEPLLRRVGYDEFVDANLEAWPSLKGERRLIAKRTIRR